MRRLQFWSVAILRMIVAGLLVIPSLSGASAGVTLTRDTMSVVSLQNTASPDWYRWQGEPGSNPCAATNCSPTSVAMAIQFALNQRVEIDEIRRFISPNECRSVDPTEAAHALDHWNVPNTMLYSMDAISQAVNLRGHIVIVSLDMSKIRASTIDYEKPASQSDPANHYDRYVYSSGGHQLVVKGFAEIPYGTWKGTWVITYDPNVFNYNPNSYNSWSTYVYKDNTPKGKNRYYRYSDFKIAFETHTNKAIEILPETEPPTVTFTILPQPNQWYKTDQLFTWSIADNPGGTGVRGYKFAWNQNPPYGVEQNSSTGSVNLSAA